ncbi:MAG TPA: VCBS repeat-containing protein, partial [Candidatus Hydrogenedens sp.]|nr:VCBS repeat-containing protein [Candidatus Hydrogenedens sp.]
MTYLSFLLIAQGILISANAEDYLLFQREQIGQGIYESASVFDVNNDGILDIFSGEFWYEGADFKKSHRVCILQPIDDYYDDFSNYPMDV